MGFIDTGREVVVIDTGYGSEAYKLTKLTRELGRQISYIVITNGKQDRWINIDYLLSSPDTRATIIAHRNNPCPYINYRIGEEYTITVDGVLISLIYSPGYSPYLDDLVVCIETLRNEKVCFTSYILQPNGPYYRRCEGSSPIPILSYPEEYMESVWHILSIKPDIAVSGYNGIVWRGNEVIQAGLVTLHTLLSIIDYMRLNIDRAKEDLLLDTYLSIARERNAVELAYTRLRKKVIDAYPDQLAYPPELLKNIADKTLYEAFDKPSLEAIYSYICRSHSTNT